MGTRTVWVYTAVIVLAMIIGWVGCGRHALDPVTPKDSSIMPPASPLGDTVALGYYEIVSIDDKIEIIPSDPIRGAEFNCTPYAYAVVEEFYYDVNERNFVITAKIVNVTQFTGYDVRVIFHTMGDKYIANPDGYIYDEQPLFFDTRLPFIAYGSGLPSRMFGPGDEDSRTIIVHVPDGLPHIAPIGFWIDAVAVPREEPVAENITLSDLGDGNYRLSCTVFDHQTQPPDLIVTAGLDEFGIVDELDMILSDLNVYFVEFSADPAPDPGEYKAFIYVSDPDDNTGENDVRFSVDEVSDEDPPDEDPEDSEEPDGDCESMTNVEIMSDVESCLDEGEYTFDDFSDAFDSVFLDILCLLNPEGDPERDGDSSTGWGGGSDYLYTPFEDDWDDMLDELFGDEWDDFLDEFLGVDWDEEWGEDLELFDLENTVPFVIQLSKRDTTGFYVELDDVCVDGSEVYVSYIEHVPGEYVWTYDTLTYPWLMGITELPDSSVEYNWQFNCIEKVYEYENPMD